MAVATRPYDPYRTLKRERKAQGTPGLSDTQKRNLPNFSLYDVARDPEGTRTQPDYYGTNYFRRGFSADTDEIARELIPSLLQNFETNAGFSLNPGLRGDLENDAMEILDLLSLQGIARGADPTSGGFGDTQGRMRKLSNLLQKNITGGSGVFNTREGVLDLVSRALNNFDTMSEQERTGLGFSTDERDQLNQAYAAVLGNLAPELRSTMQKTLEDAWMGWKRARADDPYSHATGTFLGYLRNMGGFGF